MELTSPIKRDVNLKLMQSPIEIQRLRNEQCPEDIYYFSLGEICHTDALLTVKDELELITRIENTDPDDWDVEIAAIEAELLEDPDPISHFLFGTSGLICTLSWLGCIVEDHGRDEDGPDIYPTSNPWIVFYGPSDLVSLLLNAAEQADCGLSNSYDGAIEVIASDVKKLNKMATFMLANVQSQ